MRRALTRRGYCGACGPIVAAAKSRALAERDADVLRAHLLATILGAQLHLRALRHATVDQAADVA